MIGCMLEGMPIRGRKDRITEEFYLKNFADLFSRNSDIPVTSMVDPLTKVLAERLKGTRLKGGTQHKPGELSSEEINFLIKISQHSRLNEKSGFLIFEVLTTVFVGRPSIALTILDTIILLIKRF